MTGESGHGESGHGESGHGESGQRVVVAFLADPASHGGQTPERVTTHGHHLFLLPQRVLKLKRARRFPFLDYSTLALRHTACAREVAINSRFAPGLDYRLQPVTRASGGGLSLDGDGPVVDWLVSMARFPDASQFDRLLAAGTLTPALVDAMADRIVALHEAAAPAPRHFTRRIFTRTVADLCAGLNAAPAGTLDPRARDRLVAALGTGLATHLPRIQRRRRAGLVRHVHGDLHLRNWCLWHGQPTPFDAIEFDDNIACTDVLYDVAFPVMDLVDRGRTDDANRLLNRYLEATGDYTGLSLLPFYLAVRAAVRAMVATLEGRSGDDYARAALAFLDARAPRLIAIGGLSGSGKSTLAGALAPVLPPVPGAIWLRSDGIRKRLHGVTPETRLTPAAYAPDISRRVYAVMTRQAGLALRCGWSVIADATFLHPGSRRQVAALAARLGVPFAGLWLEAPAALLEQRADTRTADASDATAAVIRRQRRERIGQLEWQRLATDRPLPAVLAEARDMLGA